MLRWARTFVALLLACAVPASALAACAAPAPAAAKAQMACCAHGHDQCPMHRAAASDSADCCRHEQQRQHVMAAAEAQAAFHMTQPAMPLAVVAEPAIVLPSAAFTRGPLARLGASPPTHRPIPSSVLLI